MVEKNLFKKLVEIRSWQHAQHLHLWKPWCPRLALCQWLDLCEILDAIQLRLALWQKEQASN